MADDGGSPLVTVENLTVSFPAGDGFADAVRGISFALGRERVAIVGESGSGKSLSVRSLLGLVAAPGCVKANRLSFAGTDLTALSEAAWSRLRGAEIGFVLQDPKFALNPAHTVGRQVEETLRLHTRLGRAERRDRALAMLEAVGLENPARVYAALPAALSGGMGQRVMIAAMLINNPRLLIADEPTSALDASLRDQILDLIGRLADERKMAVLIVSHDLHQIVRFADRVLVMRRGEIVDRQNAGDLAASPHPYTRGLWACRPSAATYGTRLPVPPRAPDVAA